MLFQIERTSLWDEEKQPCDGCSPITLTEVDVRMFRTPEEYDERLAEYYGKWLNTGTNHRINKDGHIARDLGPVKRWGVEINSIEELIALKERVGHELILTTSNTDKVTPSIEIYDDYRE